MKLPDGNKKDPVSKAARADFIRSHDGMTPDSLNIKRQ